MNFLGPFAVFFIGYLTTYFFPIPKSSLSIIDIGAYFCERIGAWTAGAGFVVLLSPLGIVQLIEDYNDLLDFSSDYPQMMSLGVFKMASCMTLNARIGRFGVTRMRILYLSYPVLVSIFFSSMAIISN